MIDRDDFIKATCRFLSQENDKVLSFPHRLK